MMKMVRQTLSRLRRADEATAAVEFALILPVMLLVYIGTMEASTLITVSRKVQSVAGAVGDLVARSDGTILTTDLNDYFSAASGIMVPYSTNSVLQVVTAVRVDEFGEATVVWTRQFQDGEMSSDTPYDVGDSYPLPDEMIDISNDRMIIAAEASESYTPLYGIVFNQPINLYHSSFFMPRFGEDIAAPS